MGRTATRAEGDHVGQDRPQDRTQPASSAQSFSRKAIGRLSWEHTVSRACVRTSPMTEAGRGTTKSTQKSWTKRKKVLPWCQLAGGSARSPAGAWHWPPCQLASAPPSRCQMAVSLRAHGPGSRQSSVSAYFRRWRHLRVGHFGCMISTLTPTPLCPSASGPPWGVDKGDRLPSGVSSKA